MKDESNYTRLSSPIKITKLPKAIDPVEILRKKMFEKYRKCPFCGNEENIYVFTKRWWGKKNPDEWYKFWEKNHDWEMYHYECARCKAKWSAEPFRTDIGPREEDSYENYW